MACTRVLAVPFLLTLFSCATVGSEAWYADERGRLLERAAFDLQCAQSELRDTPLGDYGTIGVRGCGRQTTYLYVHPSRWVANAPDQAVPANSQGPASAPGAD